MALILTVGHFDKFKLDSLEDAQKLMEIMSRAKSVKDVSDMRDEFKAKFGTGMAINHKNIEVFEITFCTGEPVSAEDYQQFVEQFKPKKQQEAA